MQIFNPVWYWLQRPDAPMDPVSALQHFWNTGAAAWCSPSPVFDVAHYLRQAGEVGFDAPFAHYSDHGSFDGLSPHPLVDASAYRGRHGLPPEIDVLDYAARHADAPSLNPLFERDWYERRRERTFDSSFCAFADFIVFGQKHGIAPFPLFDPVWFEAHDFVGEMPPFEKYWARLPVDDGFAFPFRDNAFLQGRERIATDKVGFVDRGPVSRLLDPFEVAAGACEFSTAGYLADVYERGHQLVLQAGAQAMSRLLVPTLGESHQVVTQAWVDPPPADEERSCLTIDEATTASGSAADVLLFGADGLPEELVQALMRLAARPDTGMVGVDARVGIATGFIRPMMVPHRCAFAVNSWALEAVGGFDSAFVTPQVAAADLALRLAAFGHRNLEMAGPTPAFAAGSPDPVDVILLFDRHRNVLGTFDRAQRISAGDAF